jgi:anti-sigma factor RsiW
MEEHITTSSEPEWGEEALVDERDLLFNAYFEDDLDPEDRLAFEERLDDDPEFRREFDSFSDMMSGLHELPFEFAPDDFVERVQTRVRTRSRGRFFNEQPGALYRYRIPYEIIAIVMIIVMAGSYLLMEAPRDSEIHGDLTIDAEETAP